MLETCAENHARPLPSPAGLSERLLARCPQYDPGTTSTGMLVKVDVVAGEQYSLGVCEGFRI